MEQNRRFIEALRALGAAGAIPRGEIATVA
jgi:hypothetical protein